MQSTFKSYVYEQVDSTVRRRLSVEPLESIRDRFDGVENLSTASEEVFMTGHFYPGLQPIRKLRKYRKQAQSVKCRKDSRKGNEMGCGVFFVFCLDCKHCLGFHVMHESEGPRTVR